MDYNPEMNFNVGLRDDLGIATVKLWTTDSLNPPVGGPLLAIDTETLPIQNPWSIPDVVLMQVCNGKQVDLVPYDQIVSYLRISERLSAGKRIYAMFNASFDLSVLREHSALWQALMENRLIDVSLRHLLYQLRERGYGMEEPTLAELVWTALGVELEKDDDIRLSYSRDMKLTRRHAQYAALDALATWHLARSAPEMVLEHDETRASVAFGGVMRRGFLVDKPEFSRLRNECLERMRQAEDKIRTAGFPIDGGKSVLLVESDAIMDWMEVEERDVNFHTHGRTKYLALAGLMLESFSRDGSFSKEQAREWYREISNGGHPGCSTKAEIFRAMHEGLQAKLELVGASMMRNDRKTFPSLRLLRTIIQAHDSGMEGKMALAFIQREVDDAGGWLGPVPERIGPKKFLQEHLRRIQSTTGVAFPRTEKSEELKVSKDFMWMLEERGYKDEFLNDYLAYKHEEKLLSTYFNEEHIREDGRVHARFLSIKRTFRTGCRTPNLQNYPSYARGVFVPDDGHVLLAIDYKQLELCALAQECLTRFQKSRLASLINQGLDVHYWFAGRMLGLITDSNDLPDRATEEDIRRMTEIFREIPESKRRWAKAANFGFPGGMHEAKFLQTARASGILDMKMDDARHLRSCWLKSFPEMTLYLQPTRIGSSKPEGEFGQSEELYGAENRLGQIRRYCSANAACNFPFQSLAAAGAKRALWNLYTAGLPVVNFVHDEFVFEILLDMLKRAERVASHIMVESMRSVIPDVRIAVDAMAMLRWDKKAKSIRDANGDICIWTPQSTEGETK